MDGMDEPRAICLPHAVIFVFIRGLWLFRLQSVCAAGFTASASAGSAPSAYAAFIASAPVETAGASGLATVAARTAAAACSTISVSAAIITAATAAVSPAASAPAVVAVTSIIAAAAASTLDTNRRRRVLPGHQWWHVRHRWRWCIFKLAGRVLQVSGGI